MTSFESLLSAWDRPSTTRTAVAAVLIGTVLVVVICLPRFGGYREPPSPDLYEFTQTDGVRVQGLTVDMREYLTATAYYGDRGPAPDVAPFTYRLAVPLVAGLLPWEAPTSLSLVAMAGLLTGVPALVLALRRLGAATGPLWVGVLLYAVAFPVYYWGAFDYPDGAVVGLATVVVALLLYERNWEALLVLFLALMVKESALVCSAATMAWFAVPRPGIRRRWVWPGLVGVVTLVGLVVPRVVAPDASRVYNSWLPTLTEMQGYFGANIGRFGPPLQVLLSGIVPLGLALFAYRKRRRGCLECSEAVWWSTATGVVFGVLLNVQALLTAQWDGRTIWTIYPYAIPLGVVALTSSGDRSTIANDVAPDPSPNDRGSSEPTRR